MNGSPPPSEGESYQQIIDSTAAAISGALPPMNMQLDPAAPPMQQLAYLNGKVTMMAEVVRQLQVNLQLLLPQITAITSVLGAVYGMATENPAPGEAEAPPWNDIITGAKAQQFMVVRAQALEAVKMPKILMPGGRA